MASKISLTTSSFPGTRGLYSSRLSVRAWRCSVRESLIVRLGLPVRRFCCRISPEQQTGQTQDFPAGNDNKSQRRRSLVTDLPGHHRSVCRVWFDWPFRRAQMRASLWPNVSGFMMPPPWAPYRITAKAIADGPALVKPKRALRSRDGRAYSAWACENGRPCGRARLLHLPRSAAGLLARIPWVMK